jgi:diguanylate cyclase (GGDEF)-like protein/PAS domain S-box-containing protein
MTDASPTCPRNGAGNAPVLRAPPSTSEPAGLRRALDAAGGIVVLTDAARRISWCNPAFSALTGYSLAEALGQSPGALLQFDGTDPRTVAAMRARLAAGLGFRGVIRNRGRHGRLFWLDVDIQPVRDATGTITGFVAVQTDVTERQAEHNHLRKVIEGAAAGILVSDECGRIVSCNPEARRLLNCAGLSPLGERLADLRGRLVDEQSSPLAPEDMAPARALSHGQAVRGEVVGLRADDGQLRWLEGNSCRIDGLAEGTAAVVTSFTDVTARRSAQAELADERMRLAAALDGTEAGVWEWNPETGEARVDEHWARIGGRTLDELEPVSFKTWIELVHLDDVPALNKSLVDHLAGRSPVFAGECRIRHRTGRLTWVSVRGRIAGVDHPGRAGWMYGTLLDINAAKEREIALQLANFQLRALFDLSPIGKALGRLGEERLLETNEALAQMLGYTRDQLTQMGYAQLMPPGQGRQLRRWLRELLAHRRFGPSDTELMHASGRRVPVLLSSMLVELPGGQRMVWVAAHDLTTKKQLELRLRREASTDRLTGLPNREVLIERLQQSARRAAAGPGHRFALLFLDFDRFKLVNDTLGHRAGDDLLKLATDRIRGAMRRSDARAEGTGLLARLGGDEFVVLLEGIAGAETAARVAQRMLDAVSEPFELAGRELHMTASIGIVVTDGDGSDAEVSSIVMRHADIALYEAKRKGRNGYAFFDATMQEQLARSVRVEAGLRRAIASAQMTIVYQPIVDLNTGSRMSVEALVRWRDADLGVVSPAEFIPIAEESGLVIPLGEWVLREACCQWRRWQDEAPERAPATMSVNLSRVQMALGERLTDLIAEVIRDAAMPPGALQLEVTEREVMRDPAAMLALMRGLRRLGVRLAMDDFGTGASSLACLRDYPFDVIKIDKTFVDELGTRYEAVAVLEGTVMMIERLGIVSVAEGIETAVQLEALRSIGCRLGQGYLFSRPVPADQVLALPAAAAAGI